MTLLGKTETTQQSGDNSININAGGDVACYGLSYRDVRDIVDDMLRDRFNQLSRIAREEAQKTVHAFLERWLPELSQDKFHRFQEPKMQMFLHDLFSASFESDGDEDVEKILFHALKANLDDANRQKNAIIRRAVQILPQLSQMDIDYLSFRYCCDYICLSKNRIDKVEYYVDNVLSKLFSKKIFESDFLSHLYGVHCLQSVIRTRRYKLFENRTSFDKVAYYYMKDKYKKCSSFNIMERIVYLCFMKLTFDDCRHYFMKKIDSGTSSYFKIFNYNYKIYSNFELTAVGRAIALFNCKAKMKGFEDAEFTI